MAANEAFEYTPDLVLFQETPSRVEVAKIASANGLASCLNGDASILARGTVEPVSLPRDVSNFALARVTFKGGRRLLVASLRLRPPVFRIDLWNPDCWRIQREERGERRKELRQILRLVAKHRRGEPLIIAGDFNAPAGDAIYRELSPALRDTVNQAGRGPCNTAINDFPFARIDQIWVSDGVQAIAHGVRKTQFSDHRLVVADLEFLQ